MSSDDFARICRLYFDPDNKLRNVSIEFGRNSGIATLEFETPEGVVSVESGELDAVLLAFQFRSSTGKDGAPGSAVIQDLEKFYAEIDDLLDPEREKLSAAMERVTSGDHSFGFSPPRLVREFVESSRPASRRFLPLKAQYFEVVAGFLAEARSYSVAHKKIVTRPKAERVYLAAEKTIRRIWSDDSWIDNFVRLRRYLRLDLDEASRRLGQQLQAFERASKRLAVHGAIPAEEGVQYLLDFYRRFSEFCSPLVNSLRVAVEMRLGEENPEPKKKYVENCEFLRAQDDAAVLLTLDPWIRHAESHLETKVLPATHEVVIPRGRGDSRTYSFAEVSEMTEELIRDIVPGLFTAFVLSNSATTLGMLLSYEYKVRLLRIDNEGVA